MQREQEELAVKRQREYEELQRRQRECEEKQRVQRELEEEINRQVKMENKRKMEIEEKNRRTKVEEHHHHQQVVIKKTERSASSDYDLQQKQYVEQQMRQQQQQQLQLQQQQICQKEQQQQLEADRQRRLQMEREEHEKYILEKLRQEQELYEIQQRKKLMQDQQEKEQQQRCKQQTTQVQIFRNECKIEPKPVVDVQCIDNISLYTKRIVEENRKSTEIYEERRVATSSNNCAMGGQNWQQQQQVLTKSGSGQNFEKQIDIRLEPVENKIKKSSHINTSQHNLANNQHHHHHHQHQQQAHQQQHTEVYSSNLVDHCLSTNNNHKHVLIVNTQKPECQTIVTKAPLPPNSIVRSIVKTNKNTTETFSNKYAIKHKANRYVSGAIGILETSLNGEYIILENLSSNKTVNLRGWYIHKYVPDQGINVIYKFTDEIQLCSGEKLKILAKSAAKQQRSSSVHEGLNKPNFTVPSSNEKVLIAHNVENWGTYSKYSVTKLINPEGVDKAVLTQSLLRLASSTNNVNTAIPADVDSQLHLQHHQQQHQQNNIDLQRRLKTNSKSSSNLNTRNSLHNLVECINNESTATTAPTTASMRMTLSPCVCPCPEVISTTTTKTSTTTSHESSIMTTTKQVATPCKVVTANDAMSRPMPPMVNINLTRQF